jgi:hypothetical protein
VPDRIKKKPALTRAWVCSRATRGQTLNHSHSIVAGGLPEMS